MTYFQNPRGRSRPPRNPRYVPEALERKLSPGAILSPTAAEIGPSTAAPSTPLPVEPPDPPLDLPGPSGPA
jgi:hypothetical protein